MNERGGVAFHTLGCKVNRVESDTIAAAVLKDGFSLASEEDASVIVINTCTVTGEADAKARKAVRQALKAAGRPLVVVTGCLAAIAPDELAALGERVVVEPDKSRIAGRVSAALDGVAPRGARGACVALAGEGFRTRASIKVEDGCDNFCTYCIVPYARKAPRSVARGDVVSQAMSLVEAGVSEIVLTGINIGRYQDAGADLAALVAEVAATGVARLRLSSIEPPDLTERLLAVLAATPSVCRHLHVPLQSGSDAVLAGMGRAYTVAEYRSRVDAAREALPGLALTTDVIAGFPTETVADHRRTLEFVESVGFSKLHVFRYSQRAGTPAAALPQLSPAVRARRAGELRAIGGDLRSRYIASNAGRLSEVLVERVRDGLAEGTTRDYLRVRLPAEGRSVGDLVEVTLSADAVV